MQTIKHLFYLLFIAAMTFSGCQTQDDNVNDEKLKASLLSPKTDVPTLYYDLVSTFRLGKGLSANSPDYLIYLNWKTTHPDAPQYTIDIRYSQMNQPNRAVALRDTSRSSKPLPLDSLKSYSGNSLFIRDYSKDFLSHGNPNSGRRNGKSYTIVVKYADQAKYGTDSIGIEIEKFFDPTTPHSEGDVMKKPFGP